MVYTGSEKHDKEEDEIFLKDRKEKDSPINPSVNFLCLTVFIIIKIVDIFTIALINLINTVNTTRPGGSQRSLLMLKNAFQTTSPIFLAERLSDARFSLFQLIRHQIPLFTQPATDIL